MMQPTTRTLRLNRLALNRRLILWLMLAVLAVSVALLAVRFMPYLRPAATYLSGAETVVEVHYEGIGCGAHLTWSPNDSTIEAGTRVRFVNASGYWQIPIQIETVGGDETEIVATSPVLSDGESWTHVFWNSGQYKITSSKPMVRLAGLEGTIAVRGS